MADNDVQALQTKVAELEQQLREERDDFEWDLKAAREASEATIKKLEEEIARLRHASAPPGAVGREVEALTQRALLAERKVAELQQEVQRARNQPSLSPAPRDNPLLVQRAEAAEKERDGLRKELRAAQRELEDGRRALTRAEEQGREAAELKRQLADARRDLESTRQQARKAEQGGEGLQLRADLTRLEAELKERQSHLEASQARVRELSDQLHKIEGLQAERDALAAERDALARELDSTCDRVASLERELGQARKAASSGEVKGERTQVTRLESELTSLKAELAQTRMASGQIADHRDREVERLKSSLKSVEAERTEARGQADGLRAELERVRTRLEREVSVLRLECDQAVAELHKVRSRESTAVGDPFDVKTVRVPMGAVVSRAGSEDNTQPRATPGGPPPPPVDAGSSLPVVPGELVAAPGEAGQEFGQAEPVSPEARAARSASFARGATAQGASASPDTLPEFLGDPELQVSPDAGGAPVEERLEPIDSLEPLSPEVEPPRSPLSRTGEYNLEAVTREVSLGQILPEVAQEPPAADAAGAAPDAAPAASPAPSRADPTELKGKPLAKPRVNPPAPRRSGGGWKTFALAGGGLALAALLVLGAWHFFPRWFGTQVEGEPPSLDAGAPSPADGADRVAVAEGADAGPAGQPDAGLAEQPDAGPAAPADAPDAGAVASADADQGEDAPPPAVADADPADQPPPPRFKADAATRAAEEHGLKLLQKKRYAPALAHLAPWVKRAPRDPVLHYLHGRTLFYLKKPQDAALALERATELDPAYADAYYELGGVYLHLKDKERGRAALQKFVELKPKDRRTPAIKQLLQKLP
ncbi:MAG TPA: tetratricopeptide repeat protein [Myxococcota bacterium]|nr:tetratricopeptide repeat protein [Myxococcota bacterium]HRY94240.1 tetratricopeptide repeat protein [Myxococcota bacterium]HSA23549.1 tetratricopeptide repeat protein [Myxococcota bacterium]